MNIKRLFSASKATIHRRVLSRLFLPVVILYLATIAYQSVTNYDESLSKAHTEANDQAQQLAYSVEARMLNDMSNCLIMSRLMEDNLKLPRKQREAKCDEMMKSLYDDNNHYMAIWYNWQIFTVDPTWNVKFGRIRATLTRMGDDAVYTHDTLDVAGEREGSLYASLHKACKPAVTDPYFEDYQGKYKDPILEASICSPMLDKKTGEFVGMFGVDVSLDSFQTIFESLITNNDTHAILYSTDGSIIASTNRDEKGRQITPADTASSDEIYTKITPVKTTYGGDVWHLALMFDNNKVMEAAEDEFMKSCMYGFLGLFIIWFLFGHFVKNIVHPITAITEYANELADGHLNSQLSIDNKRRDEVGQVMKALEKMGASMRSAIEEMRESATVLQGTASNINSDLQLIADQALQQASSMQEIATSMQEINNASNANHRFAQSALDISNIANAKMQEGAATVNEASDSMKEISHHLGTIREIANQTTILSLNANVEAARAGEAGKGFMVVATAIRDLAERCREISNSIEALVDEGNTKASAAVSSMNQVMPDIDETANIVKEITTNSFAQSTSVNEISSAIETVNTASQSAAARADRMTEYASDLNKQSLRLSALVANFEI